MSDYYYQQDFQIDILDIPGTAGRIGMCQCPGTSNRYDLLGDLQIIADSGAVMLISLITNKEYKTYGVTDLHRLVPPNITHLKMPISDMSTPNKAFNDQWNIYNPNIKKLLLGNQVIILHCLAGMGRTGTICARILIEDFDIQPEQAIQMVRKARPGTIQTNAQENYLLNRRWEYYKDE